LQKRQGVLARLRLSRLFWFSCRGCNSVFFFFYYLFYLVYSEELVIQRDAFFLSRSAYKVSQLFFKGIPFDCRIRQPVSYRLLFLGYLFFLCFYPVLEIGYPALFF